MNRVERILDRLATLQRTHAGWFLIGALLLGAAAVPLVGQLGVTSDWTALLPSNKPSVRDLEAARDRVGGLATLTIVVQSRRVDAMQRFASDLVPRVERLRGSALKLRSVDWNIASYEDFVVRNKALYADLDDLRDIRDALRQRLEYEAARANPFFFDLEDPPPSPRELFDRMQHKAAEGRSKLARFPGGYYIHPDGKLLAIFLRTDIAGGDAASTALLIDAVDREVQTLGSVKYAHDLKVEYAGDLLVSREEHDAVVKELAIATTLTVILCLGSIYLLFFRLRVIPLLGLSLAVPVLVTFAYAELVVDDLNASTAFLGSIIVGNGINPFIVWLARYFEERRKGRAVDEAISRTHRGVWSGTLTASLAASVAYGSLVITDFRGFRDFGIIGGVGMVLCWIGTMTILPALTVASERLRPIVREGRRAHRNIYGLVFSRIAFGAPRIIVGVSLLLAVVSIGLVVHAVASDPLEYDFRNLRSVRPASSRASKLNGRVNDILRTTDSAGGNAIAILVPRRQDVVPLRDQIERQRDHKGAPFGQVRTIDDLLPKNQDEKIPILRDIRALLVRARQYASEEERVQIDENIPPSSIRKLLPEDLPDDVARPFTERDGARGRILFVEKKDGPSVWDGRFLVHWARALRELRLEDGTTRPPLVGRAPVFADMLEAILVDGPKAVVVSFALTVLLVILTFRAMRERLMTVAVLLLGVLWMVGAMAAASMKLNFLNFVAFPIAFGTGVDYAVNVMRRYAAEKTTARASQPDGPARAAVEETGGAVILCSLTTIIGYLSLFTSANLALNSFGAATGIAEVTCLIAAVLTMPAMLYLLDRRRMKAGKT